MQRCNRSDLPQSENEHSNTGVKMTDTPPPVQGKVTGKGQADSEYKHIPNMQALLGDYQYIPVLQNSANQDSPLQEGLPVGSDWFIGPENEVIQMDDYVQSPLVTLAEEEFTMDSFVVQENIYVEAEKENSMDEIVAADTIIAGSDELNWENEVLATIATTVEYDILPVYREIIYTKNMASIQQKSIEVLETDTKEALEPVEELILEPEQGQNGTGCLEDFSSCADEPEQKEIFDEPEKIEYSTLEEEEIFYEEEQQEQEPLEYGEPTRDLRTLQFPGQQTQNIPDVAPIQRPEPEKWYVKEEQKGAVKGSSYTRELLARSVQDNFDSNLVPGAEFLDVNSVNNEVVFEPKKKKKKKYHLALAVSFVSVVSSIIFASSIIALSNGADGAPNVKLLENYERSTPYTFSSTRNKNTAYKLNDLYFEVPAAARWDKELTTQEGAVFSNKSTILQINYSTQLITASKFYENNLNYYKNMDFVKKISQPEEIAIGGKTWQKVTISCDKGGPGETIELYMQHGVFAQYFMVFVFSDETNHKLADEVLPTLRFSPLPNAVDIEEESRLATV